jgi:8-oxo-dGTP pyrophosphatase MutT (NUDIX family)
MGGYNNSSFPPRGSWDRRLTEAACTELQPVATLHENPWFCIRDRGGYFTLEYHLRTVVVLPVVNDRSIVMVRAQRPVICDMSLELPAGAVEQNEIPQFAAARELAEETGIEISQLERFIPMPPISISPNRTPMLSYVFRIDVSEREFEKRGPHDSEIHSVLSIAISDLPRMMACGEIYVSVPLAIIGIFLAARGDVGRTTCRK